MNWQEVLRANKNRMTAKTCFHFNEFSEEDCITYSKIMSETLKQLEGLGDNLTLHDFDKVNKLMDKLDKFGAMYRYMRNLDSPENRNLNHFDRFINGDDNKRKRLAREQKNIDNGIKNYDTNEF
jgi:hypothetical protein